MMKLQKPVLLVVFKRPDLTSRLMETLARVQPPRLYIAADAPRSDKPGEAAKCAAVRAVLEEITWPCEVFRDYAKTNLGSRRRVSSAVSWLFEHETDGIILEDDCHPSDSFFPYCEELLDRYKDDPRVMVISGDRGLKKEEPMEASYFFAKYTLTWGWATWRRAWQTFDPSLLNWPSFRGEPLRKKCLHEAEYRYWTSRLERVLSGVLECWDWRWMMSCWMQNGLAAIPSRNLIQNMGFDADATHTKDRLLGNFSYEKSTLSFPLRHPSKVEPAKDLEALLWRDKFKPAGLYRRVRRKVILAGALLISKIKLSNRPAVTTGLAASPSLPFQ